MANSETVEGKICSWRLRRLAAALAAALPSASRDLIRKHREVAISLSKTHY